MTKRIKELPVATIQQLLAKPSPGWEKVEWARGEAIIGIIPEGGSGTRLFPLTEPRSIPKSIALGIGPISVGEIAAHNLALLSGSQILWGTTPPNKKGVQQLFGHGPEWSSKWRIHPSIQNRYQKGGDRGSAESLCIVAQQAGVKASDDFWLVIGMNDHPSSLRDTAGLIDFAQKSKFPAVIGVMPVSNPENYGTVATQGGKVIEFREKDPDSSSNLANIGTYVMHASILPRIQKIMEHLAQQGNPRAWDLGGGVFPYLASDGLMGAFPLEHPAPDFGQLGTHFQAVQNILEYPEQYPHITAMLGLWANLYAIGDSAEAWIEHGPQHDRILHQIETGEIRAEGRVYLGGGIFGGENHLHSSILGSEVRIAEGIQVIRSNIGCGARLGASVERSTVDQNAIVSVPASNLAIGRGVMYDGSPHLRIRAIF